MGHIHSYDTPYQFPTSFVRIYLFEIPECLCVCAYIYMYAYVSMYIYTKMMEINV